MAAFEEIKDCIDNNLSFVVEAGAGSGKTYALIQTLNYLIETAGSKLTVGKQKIVCITYTNVAKNEIIKRIEYNDLVKVCTIHEFLWQSIKQFQKQLKVQLCKLNEIRLESDIIKTNESRYIKDLGKRINEVQEVFYNDSSFRDFEKGELHHDDVIVLSKMLFQEYPLLTSVVAQKFPFILVDEYQDTSTETIRALIDFLLSRNIGKVVLGFYGDSHQNIYESGIGSLADYYDCENTTLKLIKKEENYRSSKAIVNLLNNFRTNISQHPMRDSLGSAKFIYWSGHPEKPKKGIREFNKGLKDEKNQMYDLMVTKLADLSWNFTNNSKDKILVLANSRIAERAGFPKLYEIYSQRYGLSTKERLLDRNHFLIKLFTGYIDKKTSTERKTGLEHLMSYWSDKNHNQTIRFLRNNGTILSNFEHSKKLEVTTILNDLLLFRENMKVKDVLDGMLQKGLILSNNYDNFVTRLYQDLNEIDPEVRFRVERDKLFYESFLNLPYIEILRFWKHIQNETVFSTKHGTKGDEFRNVLTVIDDTEWISKYNFNNFFNDTDESIERKLLTRNLFYVECSRAKENLIVLMLSKIEENSLKNIKKWFGENNVIDIHDFVAS